MEAKKEQKKTRKKLKTKGFMCKYKGRRLLHP